MKKYFYAITVIGKDKPGIVAAVAKVLYEKGFSIEDSSSTLLKDQFSMILIVSIDTNLSIIELKKSFYKVRTDLEMSVSIRRIEPEELKELENKKEENLFMISVYGSDKPGIVYGVSELFAENNINIIDLRTRVTKADKPLYVMIMEVEVPYAIEEDKLNKMLDAACSKLGVDYSLRKVETYEL
jgi:glycine cleavage system transcriptional repressor